MDASGHLGIIDCELYPEKLEFEKITYVKPPNDIKYLTINNVGFNVDYINKIYDLISPYKYALKKLKSNKAIEVKSKGIKTVIEEADCLFLKKYDTCIMIAPRVGKIENWKTADFNDYFRPAAGDMLVI